MYDILIKNGRVIDGTGAPGFEADVAIEDGKITAVGRLDDAEARRVIDASGHVVSPGFVDMHSHADFTLPANPTANSMIQQGITTATVGMCGSTMAPLLRKTRDTVIGTIGQRRSGIDWNRLSTFASVLDYLEQLQPSINVVPFVGQGMIRAAVMGFRSTPANAEQIQAMQDEVSKAMDAGAWGVSSGLIYTPGSYASTEEIIQVVQPAGTRKGFYFTHMRDEAFEVLDAIAEAIRIGKETRTSVEIAHYKAAGRANWSKSAQGIEMINQARADGLDISADLYPYLAGSSALYTALPAWVQEGGKEAILMRLKSKSQRPKIVEDMQREGYFSILEWDKVLIANSIRKPEYQGRYVADLAREAGKDPYDWVFDALIESDIDPNMVYFAMDEEVKAQELRVPWMMIGTDGAGLSAEGPLSDGTPHPRNYGTFPRVLSHYVRELQVLTLEEAVRKMCGLPAEKLRWHDRGLLRIGYRADANVWNPDTIQDTATYEQPHQYPRGLPYVIVNGVVAVDNGKHTGARSGQVLRRPW